MAQPWPPKIQSGIESLSVLCGSIGAEVHYSSRLYLEKWMHLAAPKTSVQPVVTNVPFSHPSMFFTALGNLFMNYVTLAYWREVIDSSHSNLKHSLFKSKGDQ